MAAWSTFSGASARADEFSPLPANDPILKSLLSLQIVGDGARFRPGPQTTRYEAALGVARVLAHVELNTQSLSKTQWRTLGGLLKTLAPELKTLGVDLAAARLLCEQNEKATGTPRQKNALGLSLAPRPQTRTDSPNFASPGFASSLLSSASLGLPTREGLGARSGSDELALKTATLPISNRLRAGAALLSLERAQNDPLEGARTLSRPVGQSASLAYDVTPWLSFRAARSQRDLKNTGDDAPILGAPLFAGADKTSSTSGGLGVNLGALSLGAEVEKFRGDNRLLGTRVGGGAQISAWENRLLLSAHLSRLLPEDRAALPATAAEFGVGARVTQRLSLNLMYQGLFTAQPNKNAERVAGGLSLSF